MDGLTWCFCLLLFGSAIVLMLLLKLLSFQLVSCLCPEAKGKKQLVAKRFDKAPCLVRTMHRLCTKHGSYSPQYHWEQTTMSALPDYHTMYQ